MRKTCFIALLILCFTAWGDDVYLTPLDFLNQVFDGAAPQAEVHWLTPDDKSRAADILQHPTRMLRQRYWQKAGRSAWILDEIGKEKPISIGVVIDQGRIETIRVLVFRETRGWEVKHDFFTDQFLGASLTDDQNLDRHIDGISGATLSVRAMTKVARLALYLDQRIQP